MSIHAPAAARRTPDCASRPWHFLSAASPHATERFQAPFPFRRGRAAPKDVRIAVVRSHFEKEVLRPVPLIQQFFHDVIPATQAETNRTLVPFVAGVAEYLDLHPGTSVHTANYTLGGPSADSRQLIARQHVHNAGWPDGGPHGDQARMGS